MSGDDVLHTMSVGEDFLEHHGVKGQKWGVRKQYDPHPRESAPSKPTLVNGFAVQPNHWSDSIAKAQAKEPQPSKAEKIRNITANDKKFRERFEPSGGPHKPLTPEQKKALKIAAGIGIAAIVAGAAVYYGKQPNLTPQLKDFLTQQDLSRADTWSGKTNSTRFVRPSSFVRTEIRLPPGHEFTRISRAAETEFKGATYAVTHKADYDRYLGEAFGNDLSTQLTGSNVWGKDLHKITFAAKEEVRIPDMKTTLDIFRESQIEHGLWPKHVPMDDATAAQMYSLHSGGTWDHPPAEAFKKTLMKHGYHGIVDEMDAGVHGDSPIVIFDHSVFTPKVATKIKSSDIKASRKAITPLLNPKVPAPTVTHSTTTEHEDSEAEFLHMMAVGEDFLEHHGVKGMKWGVRKAYVAHPNIKKNTVASTKLSKTHFASRMENEKKSLDKLNPPGHDGHLTDREKKALKIAAGVAGAAVILGGAYYGTTHAGSLPPALNNFLGQSLKAKEATWGGKGYLTSESWTRPEITLKAGHEFSRLSKSAETSWSPATYASSNNKDFERYVANWGGRLKEGGELYKVSFKTKQDTKVPNLKTVIDTVQEVMKAHPEAVPPSLQKSKGSQAAALEWYQRNAGFLYKDKLSGHLFESLQKKGYHAMIDEMDQGVLADTPMVVFGHSAMTPKVSTKLTVKDVDEIYHKVKTLKYSKG